MPMSEVTLTKATQRIIALLEPAPKPMTFSQLKEAARLGDEEMKSALEAATEQGAVFRWPDYRKSQCFWNQSPDQTAQQAVLEIAAKEALPRTELIKMACKALRGFSQTAMKRIVVNLLASHELKPVRAFTSGDLLMRPGIAAAYAAAARKFIEKKFRKAGFDPAEFLRSPPSGNAHPVPHTAIGAPAEILDAIRSLEPIEGVSVSVRRLRNHLPGLGKHDFDSAALGLRNAQKVFLSLHHDAHNLPQQERDLLIDGGDGSFYVEVAIRK